MIRTRKSPLVFNNHWGFTCNHGRQDRSLCYKSIRFVSMDIAMESLSKERYFVFCSCSSKHDHGYLFKEQQLYLILF